MKERGPDGQYEKPKYEYPIHGINWTSGIGRPAGIYWLDGESVIATHGSAAEDQLLERGAILVATLRFDPDPLERSHANRRVLRRSALQMIRLTAP